MSNRVWWNGILQNQQHVLMISVLLSLVIGAVAFWFEEEIGFQNALSLMQLSLWWSLEPTEGFSCRSRPCSDLYADLDLLAEKSSVSNSSAASVDSGQSSLHAIHSAKHTRLPHHSYASSTGKHPPTEGCWSGKQTWWGSRSPVICWFFTYFE